MVFGARSVAAAEEALTAESNEVAAQKSAEASELLRGAVQILQRAAELGLSGPEGDAAAMVGERAMFVVGEAQKNLEERLNQPRAAPGPDTSQTGGLNTPVEGATDPAPTPPSPFFASHPRDGRCTTHGGHRNDTDRGWIGRQISFLITDRKVPGPLNKTLKLLQPRGREQNTDTKE